VTFLQWKKRLLNDEYWAFSIRFTGNQLLRQKGFQGWWERNRETYVHDYRMLIDKLIV
jgi:hypothetical protein